MPAINLASKASPKVVERFKLNSVTEGLSTADYNWTGVATVRVYSIDPLTLNDYDKTITDFGANGSRFGPLTEVGDTIQEMTVSDDKSFNGSIDKGNNTAQLQIKAASKILKQTTDEVLIPYVDKYRLTKMAAGAGTVEAKAISKTTGIETILTAGATMSNKLVPKNNRVLFIGETLAIQLKLADQVIGVDKLAEKSIVNGEIGMLDGMHVRIVPDSYMPQVDISSTSTPSLKTVNFMIVLKGVVCFPKKIETYRILTEHPDIDGHVVQGRFLHDAFVLNTKKDGIYVGYAS